MVISSEQQTVEKAMNSKSGVKTNDNGLLKMTDAAQQLCYQGDQPKITLCMGDQIQTSIKIVKYKQHKCFGFIVIMLSALIYLIRPVVEKLLDDNIFTPMIYE